MVRRLKPTMCSMMMRVMIRSLLHCSGWIERKVLGHMILSARLSILHEIRRRNMKSIRQRLVSLIIRWSSSTILLKKYPTLSRLCQINPILRCYVRRMNYTN